MGNNWPYFFMLRCPKLETPSALRNGLIGKLNDAGTSITYQAFILPEGGSGRRAEGPEGVSPCIRIHRK